MNNSVTVQSVSNYVTCAWICVLQQHDIYKSSCLCTTKIHLYSPKNWAKCWKPKFWCNTWSTICIQGKTGVLDGEIMRKELILSQQWFKGISMVIRAVWNGRLDWTCHKLPKKHKPTKEKKEENLSSNWRQCQGAHLQLMKVVTPQMERGALPTSITSYIRLMERARVKAGVVPTVGRSLGVGRCFQAPRHGGWCVLVSWADLAPPETGGAFPMAAGCSTKTIPQQGAGMLAAAALASLSSPLRGPQQPSGRGTRQNHFLPLHRVLLLRLCYTHPIGTGCCVYMPRIRASLRQDSSWYQILHFAAASVIYINWRLQGELEPFLSDLTPHFVDSGCVSPALCSSCVQSHFVLAPLSLCSKSEVRLLSYSK